MLRGTWFGLGLGTKDMAIDSDMIIVDTANRKVLDMYSTGNRLPEQDDSQDLQFNFLQISSESIRVTIRRPLDTNDGKDFVLPVDTAFDLAWAVNIKTA